MSEWVILGDFNTTDYWQSHVNRIFYELKGQEIYRHFQTFVSQDYRLPHAIAEDYYQHAIGYEKRNDAIYVSELGVGNGNLASCFLNHLKTIDRDGMVYPATHYILCDYSREVIEGVKGKIGLKTIGRTSLVQLDSYRPECFKEGSIFKIISNELWDDLRTKVFVKVKGDLMEEYIQPAIERDSLQGIADIDALVKDFKSLKLTRLKEYPSFIDSIVWEHEYRPVDWSKVRYGKTIRTLFKNIREEIEVPINIGAIKTIKSAYRLLKDGGSYSIFDYGIMNIDALNESDITCHNIYGGQYTFMISLPLIEDVARFIGFKGVLKERQHQFIQRILKERMVSVVELVETHPDFNTLSRWDRDTLLLKTMHILNNKYTSPYIRSIEFPVDDDMPQTAQEAIKGLSSSLKQKGIPDTVAYISEGEVFSVINELIEAGYVERDLRKLFYKRERKTDYFHLQLIK